MGQGRKRGSPGQMAWRRIGDWPGDAVSRRRHGVARQHARGVWDNARAGAVNRADGLWDEVEGDQRSFLGQVDLAFLATVAAHLRRCERCWKEWADGETPVDLLTAAVRRIPAWEIFRAVLKEVRAHRPGR